MENILFSFSFNGRSFTEIVPVVWVARVVLKKFMGGVVIIEREGSRVAVVEEGNETALWHEAMEFFLRSEKAKGILADKGILQVGVEEETAEYKTSLHKISQEMTEEIFSIGIDRTEAAREGAGLGHCPLVRRPAPASFSRVLAAANNRGIGIRDLAGLYRPIRLADLRRGPGDQFRPFETHEIVSLVRREAENITPFLPEAERQEFAAYAQGLISALEIPETHKQAMIYNWRGSSFSVDQCRNLARSLSKANEWLFRLFPPSKADRLVYLTAGMGVVYQNAFFSQAIRYGEKTASQRLGVFTMSRDVNVDEKQIWPVLKKINQDSVTQGTYADYESTMIKEYGNLYKNDDGFREWSEMIYAQLQESGVLEGADRIVFVEDGTYYFPVFLKFIIGRKEPEKKEKAAVFSCCGLADLENYEKSYPDQPQLFFGPPQEGWGALGPSLCSNKDVVLEDFREPLSMLPNPMVFDKTEGKYRPAPARTRLSCFVFSLLNANDAIEFGRNLSEEIKQEIRAQAAPNWQELRKTAGFTAGAEENCVVAHYIARGQAPAVFGLVKDVPEQAIRQEFYDSGTACTIRLKAPAFRADYLAKRLDGVEKGVRVCRIHQIKNRSGQAETIYHIDENSPDADKSLGEISLADIIGSEVFHVWVGAGKNAKKGEAE